jgi:hypothetical protein
METEFLDKALRELKSLGEENRKLSSVKERYAKISERLLEISKEIEKLSIDLNPLVSMRPQKGRTKRKDDILAYYEKMQAGTQITIRLIESEGYSEKQAYYFMVKLSKMPGVEKVKDKNKVRLFWRGLK